MHSAEEFKHSEIFIRQEYDSVIKQTRKIIAHMSQEQRFEKAKSHVMDSLRNRDPRPMSYSPELTDLYYLLYYVQSSWLWSWLIFLLSFFYMYLVILDNQSFVQKITIEGSVLVIFIVDTLIDFYTSSFDRLAIKNKYPKLYYFKAVIVTLMLIDLIIFITLPAYTSRPIRPFRILRAILPLLYDSQIRRSFIALVSAYKELFAFIIYYSIIIVVFAFIGSQSLTFDRSFEDANPAYRGVPEPQDPYLNNYNDLSRMIYHMYGVATYDFYPDFQILAVQNYQPNYIFYVVFVFFNMFLFSSIPGAVIYNKVRETRSKYIIVDQIKQQHSLILAFVTLAQEELNLSMDMLVKFLFFFYRNKTRYVEYITEICLILDDNNNQTIQVNEFMQLSKILIYNSVMYPPRFDDIQIWLSFRRMMNEHFHLKSIVQHWLFDVIVSILTLLCSINAILLLFEGWKITGIFDSIFVWMFFTQLLVRLVAIGPETYFAYRWNNIDAFLIILNVVFFFVSTHNNIDNLFKISRVFRVAFFFRTFMLSEIVSESNSQVLQKLKRLFETFAEIFPIITRFFLIFAICFFIFGIMGMQIFYATEQINNYEPRYDEYTQFSNFKTFIHSQYIMMQVLTEGAWSKVAYNYCWRNQNYYGLIVVLFMLMHFTIVYVLGTLLKGIFWEIYFTVSSMLDSLQERLKNQQEKDENIQEKAQEIKEINEQINQNESLEPDTIIRREIIEMKMDLEILMRIKNFEQEGLESSPLKSERSIRSINRSKLVEKMMESWNINAQEFQKARMKPHSIFSPKLIRKKAFAFENLEDKEEEDIHSEMEDLLNRFIISPKIKYSYIIAYPKIFVEFLNSKFKHVHQFIGNRFDIHLNPLQSQDSMKFHMYQMSSLVDLEPSERQRKELIVECLVNNKLIDQNLAERIIKTKIIIKKFHIDSNGALKKMYLSETNEDLIRKLEVQYFSDVYGNTFKQINKVSLGPLLKVEASLTYTLWNILSYPQIHYTQFFHFLTFIQDQISNKLLKRGSIFKFVYKMASESDIWFSIEHKRHQDVQVRYIKNGLWAYTPQMYQNQIYYARDIFKWDENQSLSENASSVEEKIHEQYMKLFYQSFQTLAFSLIDKSPFFQENPRQFIYDLYLQNYDVVPNRKLQASTSSNLKISNIMLVILCKQEERSDMGQPMLPYRVSDIKTQKRKRIKEDFLLDDGEKETFEKLKNLSAMDNEKIIETQGLPFSYIINLMKQMEDYLKLYGQNFVQHVEKALSDKSHELDNNSLLTQSNMGKDEEIRIDLPEEEVEEMHIPASERFIKPN